ncbi:jg14786 [Pararge aegeria aegeria]|uniref:Jg14786 protein n=1 Tax=Pararge aegeria aegeria TaxID=348720 RepID=A0A8S4SL52_9NEOP|nr:jg14786 [Pararge aegeria aegeria]
MATIGCHYRMDPAKYPHKITVDLTFKSELNEVLLKGAHDCRNLMKPIHLSPDINNRNLTCEAVVRYTSILKDTKTKTITFKYEPPTTPPSLTTIPTLPTKIQTTAATIPTTSPTTTQKTTPTTKSTTTVPTTTTSVTTAKTTTPSTKSSITTTFVTMAQKTMTPATITPTRITLPTATTNALAIMPTPTTITTESISTNNAVGDKDTTNSKEDNKNDGEDTKNSQEFYKNVENNNQSYGEVNPNDQEVIEPFLKKHWIPLTSGFVLLCVVIVSIVVTCAVIRTRKTQKEDKSHLNSNGSRNDLDVTHSPPGRNEARTEPKINDYYSDINYDYPSPEVYSDPYMAMYSQPLPKCVRPPPKITPNPKPKPKPSYRNYSNSTHRDYNGYSELNEPSTYNNIVKNTGTMYRNTGKTHKNMESVQFYDNMAASYSNTAKRICPDVNSEPALYEVPS